MTGLVFSHNDTQENAQQTHDRRQGSTRISLEVFVVAVGPKTFEEFEAKLGRVEHNEFYQFNGGMFVSCGAIDYIFKAPAQLIATDIKCYADHIEIMDQSGIKHFIRDIREQEGDFTEAQWKSKHPTIIRFDEASQALLIEKLDNVYSDCTYFADEEWNWHESKDIIK